MHQSGKISLSQAQWIIYKECKKPETPFEKQLGIQQQQRQHLRIQENLSLDGNIMCPLCGLVGTPHPGPNGFYFTCPNGHSWR